MIQVPVIRRTIQVVAFILFVSIIILAFIYFFRSDNRGERKDQSEFMPTVVFDDAILIAASTPNPSIVYDKNLLMNGDAETGPCEMNLAVRNPTGWFSRGFATQISYYNYYGTLTPSSPGPNDRGQCYFVGYLSRVTSMWQTVNLDERINTLRLGELAAKFRLSAWLGGWLKQEDNAQISLIFVTSDNQPVGDRYLLGPVTASDRMKLTSLVYRNVNGTVPFGAHAVIVNVTMIRIGGFYNDGCIDNISFTLYQ